MHPHPKLRVALAGAALITTLSASAAPSALVAYWDFNDATNPKAAKDAVRATVGDFQATTAFTADQGGFSGLAGDRAVDFSAVAGAVTYVRVSDGSFMNLAGVTDTLTVSFWQKRHAQNDSSAFWAFSPSSGGGRGAQTHSPWSNGRIYFDTAGCCNGDQRIDKAVTDLDPAFDWSAWHHFTFVKNGPAKQVYVDGVLFLEDAEMDAAALPTDFTYLNIGADGSGGGNSRAIMDDFAVFAAVLDQAQILSLANKSKKPTEITATLADTDNDGLPDSYESLVGLDPAVANGGGDPDSDGLTNLQEYAKGTDPKNADTDGDGAKDGAETGTGTYASATDTGTNPLVADSDGDGLPDGLESNSGTGGTVANPGTNPNKADTDGDGASDGLEVHFGTSPFSAAVKPALVAGKRNLLAYFPFNDATVPEATVDVAHNYAGKLLNGAAYSGDSTGFSGKAGDNAVDFAADTEARTIQVADGTFMNLGAANDTITITFWQRLAQTAATSAFWAESPSSLDSGRGFQVHNPWSDGTIYFDTTGAGAGRRINKNVVATPGYEGFDWTAWHHFALVKNKGVKQIWIDGNLFHSGTGALPFTNDFTRLWIGSQPSGGAHLQGALDDFAVFGNSLSSADIKVLAAQTFTPLDVHDQKDTDGDGITDIVESLIGDPNGDLDGDGAKNLDEVNKGTDPANPDTDGDGLKDGAETDTGIYGSATDTGTDPLSGDSDGDGLSDGVEKNSGTFVSAENPGTNPNKSDTDGDGLPDGTEIASICGSDPTKADSVCVDPKKLNLLVYWDFNDASNAAETKATADDLPAGDVVGVIENGAVFTDDKGGRTGAAGDRAINFAPDDGSGTLATGRVVVTDATFLNKIGIIDRASFVFWQKLVMTANSSAFWIDSPTQTRVAQAHVPWSNNNIYFDTAGCCDGGTQRLNGDASAVTWTEWHHFAFVKDGPNKRIYVDGNLFLSAVNTGTLSTDIGNLFLGAEPAGGNSLRGWLDEFAVFASALNESQIDELVAGKKPSELVDAVAAPLEIGTAAVNGDNLVLAWTGGTGPFLIQGKLSLTDAAWIDLHTVAGNTASIPLAAPLGFFRVTDGAGKTVKLFKASLSGANERPTPVDKPGTGVGLLALDGLKATYVMSYQNLSGTPTAYHVHGLGSADVAVGVKFNLVPAGTLGTSGLFAGEATVDQATADGIMGSQTYFNVHTTAHGGGEIRGQIVPVP